MKGETTNILFLALFDTGDTHCAFRLNLVVSKQTKMPDIFLKF